MEKLWYIIFSYIVYGSRIVHAGRDTFVVPFIAVHPFTQINLIDFYVYDNCLLFIVANLFVVRHKTNYHKLLALSFSSIYI